MTTAFMDKCYLLGQLQSELDESGVPEYIEFSRFHDYSFTLALATAVFDIPSGLSTVEKLVDDLWLKVLELFGVDDQDFGNDEQLFLEVLGI